jgi:chemotaxis signal transduction protein
MILFQVGEVTFAIQANAVDEIRPLDGVRPYLSGKTSHPTLSRVKYTLMREKNGPRQLYFVVDATAHFRMPKSEGNRILVLRKEATALLVGGIERMAQVATVAPLPKSFNGDERRWYKGLAVIGGKVVPVVDSSALLGAEDIAILQAGAKLAAAADYRSGKAALA